MATVIFEEQILDGFRLDSDLGAYRYDIYPPQFTLVSNETYTVFWDDVKYVCQSQDVSSVLPGTVALGNATPFGFSGNNEPFIIGWNLYGTSAYAFDTETSHTLAIYQGEVIEEEDPSTNSDDIILKNYHGDPITYQDVDVVLFDTPSGELQAYSKGEVIEEPIPIILDLKDGNQTVTAPDGYLVKTAVVVKPDTLKPENIVKGVEIAGVPGGYEVETETKDVELDFSESDSITITPTDGKFLSEVTIVKPENLIPANIAKGVVIAGIEGTHSGGGGGLDDPYSKYFSYNIDSDANIVTLYTILYDKIYADTGSYDVTIPDTLFGIPVVIKCS